MKKLKLSELLESIGINPDDDKVQLEIDLPYTNLLFPNNPEVEYNSIGISFPGYGHNEMDDGDENNQIVLIEYANIDGKTTPSIYIWNDINSSECISRDLVDAKLSNREPN